MRFLNQFLQYIRSLRQYPIGFYGFFSPYDSRRIENGRFYFPDLKLLRIYVARTRIDSADAGAIRRKPVELCGTASPPRDENAIAIDERAVDVGTKKF